MNTSVLNLTTAWREETATRLAIFIETGTIQRGRIDLTLNAATLTEALGVATSDLAPSLMHLSAPFDLRRRGVEAKIIAGEPKPQPDPRTMLIRAHGWAKELKAGTPLTEIAKREEHAESFMRTRAQLAFLSPKIQAAILDGTQPTELSLKQLVRTTLPLDWSEQERRFGF